MPEPILAPDEEVTLEPGLHIPMGQPAIWWRVLEVDTDHMTALLLADEIAGRAYFDTDEEDAVWETSSLRARLNTEFPARLFPDERKAVMESETEACGREGQPVTDRFFLLSTSEAERYDIRFDPGTGRQPWWWLRTTARFCGPFGPATRASYVKGGRIFYKASGKLVNSVRGGVRPACRVDLRARYFASRIIPGESGTLRLRVPQLVIRGTHAVKAFHNAERMTVPEGITELDCGCFRDNPRLRALTLPYSLRTIEAGSFDGCRNLNELTIRFGTAIRIPDSDEHTVRKLGCGLIAVGAGAYDPAVGLAHIVPPGAEEITVPEGVTALEDLCFADMPQLRSVTLPESLQTTGRQVFSGCGSLKEVFLPSRAAACFPELRREEVMPLSCGLTAVGPGSTAAPFLLCADAAEEITVPEGVTELREGCFRNMLHLRAVTLPESLQTIGRAAFFGCEDLKEVRLPPEAVAGLPELRREKVIRLSCGLTAVGPGSTAAPFRFFGKGTEEITVPEGAAELGPGCFQDMPRLRAVTLPESLQAIGEAAFLGCEDLKEVCLPPEAAAGYPELGREKVIRLSCTLTAVGPGFSDAPIRFFGEGAEEITVPEGVTELGAHSFSYMPRLQSVTMPATLRKVGSEAFRSCPVLRTVTVRSAAVDWAANAILDCPKLEIPAAWLCNAGPLPNAAVSARRTLQPKELAFLMLFQHGPVWCDLILLNMGKIPVLLPALCDVMTSLPEADRPSVRTEWIEWLLTEHPEHMTMDFVNTFCGLLPKQTLQTIIDGYAREHETVLLPMLLQYRNTHPDDDPSGDFSL